MILNSVKAGLGLPDSDAWHIIETIAEKNNIGYKQFVSICIFPLSSFGEATCAICSFEN